MALCVAFSQLIELIFMGIVQLAETKLQNTKLNKKLDGSKKCRQSTGQKLERMPSYGGKDRGIQVKQWPPLSSAYAVWLRRD